MLLADALVKTAGDEQVNGLGMRIRRVHVAARIEREAEGVRLAVRENLEPRAVRAETIRVAAGELHDPTTSIHDLTLVRETVRPINPAVEPLPVTRRHAVGVFETETVVKFFADVGAPVAVCVGETPDRGNGKDEHGIALCPRRARERDHSDRDIEPVSKHRGLTRPPRRRIEIRQDPHRIQPVLTGFGRRRRRSKGERIVAPVFLKRRDGFAERVPLRRPRVKRRTRHPDASGRIERDIHRLL